MNFKLISGLIVVLVVGVVGVYFSFKNSFPAIDISAKKTGDDKKLTEQTGLFKEGNILGEEDSNWGYFGKFNITEGIGQSFFATLNSSETINIVQKDPEGSINALSADLAKDILIKSAIDLNFVTEIANYEIKITQDNSDGAKKKYLEDITAALDKNFLNYQKFYLEVIIDTYQKLNSSSAKKATEVYGKLAKDFQNITVPSQWAEMHKGFIRHYKNSEIIYRAMANYQNDPIKGYLALDMIEVLLDEAPFLQDELEKKFNEVY